MSNKDNTTTPPNTISLATAQSWTSEWRSVESSYNSHNECNGFLVPAADLSALLAEMSSQPGTNYIRAYLGVDPTTNKEKLVLVATTQPSGPGSTVYKDKITGYNGSGFIYDFSKPCPDACDINSPLN